MHAAHARLSRRAVLGLGAAAFAARLARASEGSGWIISAEQARALLAKGAILFDARAGRLRRARPVPGAMAVGWPDFTEPGRPHQGRLLAEDAPLTRKLRSLGVSTALPVVVIADSRRGWGEDGRVVWTLRTLGHEKSFVVDGGVDALLADGPVGLAPVTLGNFTLARTDAYLIGREQVMAALDQPDVVFLDVREPREFAGATPYGEARGGHLPGAKSLYFRDLLDIHGKILPDGALQERLAALGIDRGTKVVAYCTTGIRAGFVTAVLQDAGFDARNYAGSMTEWAASPAEAYPLVTD